MYCRVVLKRGEALTLDENIASIQFTGSTQVGRMVGANAGKTLKKVSLELGGKNSLIILDDADIERAAENIVWGAFFGFGSNLHDFRQDFGARSHL